VWRTLYVRVPAPFARVFGCIDLQRRAAVERARLGIIIDVSLNGRTVKSPASWNPGDQRAMSLRLSDQTALINIDEAVRWGYRHIEVALK